MRPGPPEARCSLALRSSSWVFFAGSKGIFCQSGCCKFCGVPQGFHEDSGAASGIWLLCCFFVESLLLSRLTAFPRAREFGCGVGCMVLGLVLGFGRAIVKVLVLIQRPRALPFTAGTLRCKSARTMSGSMHPPTFVPRLIESARPSTCSSIARCSSPAYPANGSNVLNKADHETL